MSSSSTLFRRRHFRDTTPPPPPDGHTVLHCHFNGPDGNPISLTEDVATGGTAPHSISGWNGAQYDSDVSKWGNSMLMDGVGGTGFTTEVCPDFSFGTGDFCVELWMYSNNFLLTPDKYNVICMKHSDDNNEWNLLMQHVSPSSQGVWQFCVTNVTLGSITMQGWSPEIALSNSTWYHVALNHQSGVMKFFLNGALETLTFTCGDGSGALNTLVGPLEVGCQNGWNASSFIGWFDEMRVRNMSVYAGNGSTPPTGPFDS